MIIVRLYYGKTVLIMVRLNWLWSDCTDYGKIVLIIVRLYYGKTVLIMVRLYWL